MKSQSSYYINGKPSSAIEVTDVLKSKGIDLNNNRFLILQGEVEQISLMKAKTGDENNPGFLEYLEDIIGSNTFNAKIIEQEKEFEIKQVQRMEKAKLVKISEEDLKKLDDEKNLAI